MADPKSVQPCESVGGQCCYYRDCLGSKLCVSKRGKIQPLCFNRSNLYVSRRRKSFRSKASRSNLSVSLQIIPRCGSGSGGRTCRVKKNSAELIGAGFRSIYGSLDSAISAGWFHSPAVETSPRLAVDNISPVFTRKSIVLPAERPAIPNLELLRSRRPESRSKLRSNHFDCARRLDFAERANQIVCCVGETQEQYLRSQTRQRFVSAHAMNS